MINSFATMVHEIGNWNDAGSAEVVAETSGQHSRIADTEQVDDFLLL